MSVDRRAIAARNAVALAFALNGFCFATLVSRIPTLRSGLDLDNGSLGLLLLAIAAGSVLALPSSGRLIQRGSAAGVVRLGAVSAAEVYFRRPPQADMRTEFASLYSPYWQVRLAPRCWSRSWRPERLR